MNNLFLPIKLIARFQVLHNTKIYDTHVLLSNKNATSEMDPHELLKMFS